jgi:hypothetical protein
VIVYGDPRWELPLAEALAALAQRQATLPDQPSRDDLRALLIFAGQIEQGAHDALGDDDPAVSQLHLLTAALAEQFVGLLEAEFSTQGRKGAENAKISNDLDPAIPAFPPRHPTSDIRHLIPDSSPPTSDIRHLTSDIRIPEGFAFYALYPEQYWLAARRWLAERPAGGEAAVIGIRSIGTTLAAVVAATLRAAGWRVRSGTVRPVGHPWDRRIEALPLAIPAGAPALVVDEGPGMSGSSFLAVVAALGLAGVADDRISLVPSHAGWPGGAASDEARERWGRMARYVVAREELCFDGLDLPAALAARTRAFLDPGDAVVRVEDWGGGLWRAHVYGAERAWPAACAAFELPKYRCVARSGAAVVWKWAGLASQPGGTGAEVALAQLAAQARRGYSPAPLGAAHGFVATRWIAGPPLSPADLDDELIEHMGRSIAQQAGPPLSPEQAMAARARMDELLYWNAWELIGEQSAERIKAWCASLPLEAGPIYGDGQLAPPEWRRDPAGRLLKTDSSGHHYDHTAVGPQPAAWALAGASVEWDLDSRQRGSLLAAHAAAGGHGYAPESLRYYRLAYAAFRAGQAAMCAQMTGDPAEAARLDDRRAACLKHLVGF